MTNTALGVIAALSLATVAYYVHEGRKLEKRLKASLARNAELIEKVTTLEADLAEQHGLNAVQASTITTLRDRNAILRDTLEAVPGPVATVLDVVSRVGHKLGGFL